MSKFSYLLSQQKLILTLLYTLQSKPGLISTTHSSVKDRRTPPGHAPTSSSSSAYRSHPAFRNVHLASSMWYSPSPHGCCSSVSLVGSSQPLTSKCWIAPDPNPPVLKLSPPVPVCLSVHVCLYVCLSLSHNWDISP